MALPAVSRPARAVDDFFSRWTFDDPATAVANRPGLLDPEEEERRRRLLPVGPTARPLSWRPDGPRPLADYRAMLDGVDLADPAPPGPASIKPGVPLSANTPGGAGIRPHMQERFDKQQGLIDAMRANLDAARRGDVGPTDHSDDPRVRSAAEAFGPLHSAAIAGRDAALDRAAPSGPGFVTENGQTRRRLYSEVDPMRRASALGFTEKGQRYRHMPPLSGGPSGGGQALASIPPAGPLDDYTSLVGIRGGGPAAASFEDVSAAAGQRNPDLAGGRGQSYGSFTARMGDDGRVHTYRDHDGDPSPPPVAPKGRRLNVMRGPGHRAPQTPEEWRELWESRQAGKKAEAERRLASRQQAVGNRQEQQQLAQFMGMLRGLPANTQAAWVGGIFDRDIARAEGDAERARRDQTGQLWQQKNEAEIYAAAVEGGASQEEGAEAVQSYRSATRGTAAGTATAGNGGPAPSGAPRASDVTRGVIASENITSGDDVWPYFDRWGSNPPSSEEIARSGLTPENIRNGIEELRTPGGLFRGRRPEDFAERQRRFNAGLALYERLTGTPLAAEPLENNSWFDLWGYE